MPDTDPTTPGGVPAESADTFPPSSVPSGEVPAQIPAFDFDLRFRSQFELARGGMGRVLVAQDSLLHREVAIKELLRKENPHAVRRFEREALLTARLQHPGIVSVYEFARRASGEPVLVMRRVKGEPFEDVIAAADSLESRLALLAPFTSACDAVAYAHQEGVIHRDLKPGNVLLGAFGDTVVIDWGLAKDLNATTPSDEVAAAATDTPQPRSGEQLTMAGSVLGTPVYMAPEQARGEPAEARSDVYALGAILYHLVSGRRPYRGGDSKEVLAAVRSGPPEALANVVHGVAPELITIVDRAMAREATARYPTAGELAEELKRFQAGRLVHAHTYRMRDLFRRWLKKYAAIFVLSGIFLLVLAAGGTLALRRVLVERDRANREAEVSRRVSEFMTGMFKVSDPSEARGNSVTAREILDRAAREVESGLAQDPLIQARQMDSIGRVYWTLGLYGKAVPLLTKAVEIRRDQLGPEDPETLSSLGKLATAVNAQGRHAEAEKMQRELLGAQRRVLGPLHPDTLATLNNLGIAVNAQGHLAEAETIDRQALEERRRVLGPDHPDTLTSMNNLANCVDDQGRYPEAEKIHRDVLEARKRSLGPEHPDTLISMNNLGGTLYEQGRLAEAERVDRDVVAARLRVLGPEHPDTLGSMSNLGNALDDQGQHAEAERIYRAVLEVERRTLGAEHPVTLIAMNNLAASLSGQARFPEAEKIQREVLETRRRVLGLVHPQTLSSMSNLATSFANQGHWVEAEKLYREALDAQRRTLGAEHSDTLETMSALARVLARRGRFAEAEKMLHDVLAVQERAGSDQSNTLFVLGSVAAMRGERSDALDYLRRALAGKPSADFITTVAGSDDLTSLRRDPAFKALLEEARKR